MRNDSNPMVYRWLVDTQEYDFKLEDILGITAPTAIYAGLPECLELE
jgi:hypothetical protein